MPQIRLRWLSILFISLLMGCGPKAPPETHGLLYQEARAVKPFILEDQLGKSVSEANLKGQWTLLFLGYTSCPDICPMTLAKLTQVYEKLSDTYPVNIWFVSVDPKRDVADKRRQYIDYFNPSFTAVSAEHKQLFPFVRNLGLVYAIHDDGETENYTVDHSASVTLVDPTGTVRAIFKPEFAKGKVPIIDQSKIIEDLTKIIEYYSSAL
ncbi:SCO family protein [Pseudoalteromonas sp. G4]|uniref:SCO family protein n=1 Tax=Pseudoalteromonas sp. G4 TaxID=2992761 RepID=UPI00237E72CB|nr:SCO family protein [Pseudoalteromonas sp. G4]MDE3272617.1 SCO family protein [Pseudoalteromonas sp. G4]